MKRYTPLLLSFALATVSFAQNTIYWTGNEDRWGGGSQTGTANDNFSTAAGGTTYQKLSDGETYHHVYDRSPAGAMAGTNYGVSINRANNTISSMTLVGDGVDGFTFDTVAAKPASIAGNVTVSGGKHQFDNGGAETFTLAANTTWDVAAGSRLIWKINLAESTPGTTLTKTGDGAMVFQGGPAIGYTGDTMVSAGSFGGRATLAGGLTFAEGTKLEFNDSYTLTVTGTVTFEHASFGIADIVSLNSTVAPGTYTLIDGPGTIVGNFANVGAENAYDLGNGYSAWLQSGSLQVVVVPEAGTFGLILGLAALAAIAVRRRVGS